MTNRLLLIMKLAVFLTLMTVLQAAAGSMAQTVTLAAKNEPLPEVMEKIKKQTGYHFFLTGKQLAEIKVNTILRDAKLEDAMDALTHNLGLEWVIKDKVIILRSTLGRPVSIPPIKNLPVQQERVVTGKVTDEAGAGLEGVTVAAKGTAGAVITGSDGSYRMVIPNGANTLIFTMVGFEPAEKTVGSQEVIDIALQASVSDLDEVVVVGYGTLKKSDLTGAVGTVGGDELAEKAAVINVSEALQGTMPGLTVTRDGGSDASASSSIRIRGVTTIGDSNPLIIIDGVPAASIDRVNPNDIESISVLKDAASAAIYGSRGASGVIVVTTKRAKEGHLTMSYDNIFTFEQPTRLAKYMDAVGFMRLFNERTWNDNNNVDGTEYSTFSKDVIDNYYDRSAQDIDRFPNTDWHSLMLKNWASKNRHMISLSAGSKAIKSYVSLNVDDTEGLYLGKDYDRFTIRANNDITINKYFSADLNINGLYSKDTDPQSSQAGQAVIPGQILGAIYPAEWSDGRIAPGKGGENPYAVLKYAGDIQSKSSLVGGKFQLNFTPIKSLKFSAAYSAELYNVKIKNFRKKLTFTSLDDPINPQGLIMAATTTRLQESRNDRASTNLQFLANFTESFNNHDIQLMVGYEENTDENEYLGASRDEYTLNNFPYLNLGNTNFQFNNGSADQYANRSFFGRGVYSFAGKYLLQTNIRYDGSSRFHKDHRWGFFPSISAGWVVSEESFMQEVNDINFLKVRASWGRLGNERIGLYPYQSTIGFNEPILYQGTTVVGAQGAGVPNYTISNISWETTESYDIGIDFGLIGNKLNVTADYYKKKTIDMLLALQIPNFIGMTNPQQNTGKMHTNGWEILVSWRDQIADFRYGVSAHLSDSRSIMGDLGGTEFLGSQVKFEGSEFNEWYGYKSAGLYRTQEEVDNSATLYNNLKSGDVKYVDISGPDGVPDGKISAEYDRVLLGGSLPRYLYGGNLELGYKGFNLGLVFQGVGKQNSYINSDWVNPYYEFPALIDGTSWSYYNTDEQNQKAKFPRLTNTNGSNNYAVSDYWLFNGAYFRLKNISLSYTVPEVVVSRIKLNALRINLSASDLFSIDSFPEGWDPETTANYWINRAFTMGLSVKF